MEKNKGLGYTGTPKQSGKQEQYGNRLRPPKLFPGPQMCQMPSLCPDYLFFQGSLMNSFPSLETLFPRCVPHLSQVENGKGGKVVPLPQDESIRPTTEKPGMVREVEGAVRHLAGWSPRKAHIV